MTSRKPALAVVREGNPGKRPVPEFIVVPPAEFPEPDWVEVFSDSEASPDMVEFCREQASKTWQRTVPSLRVAVGLGDVDHDLVLDYCICVARLWWCERRLSVEGLVLEGRQAGLVRNPLTTIATQYRAQLKTYIRELGLSPLARTGVPQKPGDDSDDPFD